MTVIYEEEIREVIAPKEVNEPEIGRMIIKGHIKVLSLGNTLIPCSVPADHAAGTKFGNFDTHPPTHSRNSRGSEFAMAADQYFPTLNYLSKNNEWCEIVYY